MWSKYTHEKRRNRGANCAPAVSDRLPSRVTGNFQSNTSLVGGWRGAGEEQAELEHLFFFSLIRDVWLKERDRGSL